MLMHLRSLSALICFCHKNTSLIDADASEKFVSKSHSLVLFSVIIFECCCFKHKFGFDPPCDIILELKCRLFKHKFGFDPPCDMILLKTDGFLMEKVHTYDADASEKYVCPNYFLKMLVFGTKKSGEVSVRGSNFVWRLVHF